MAYGLKASSCHPLKESKVSDEDNADSCNIESK